MSIKIYTDGSSRYINELWYGAYSFVIYENERAIYQLTNDVKPGTNNAAEVLAVLHAIHHIKQNPKINHVNIYTDSQYVINGFKRGSENLLKTNRELWRLVFNVKGELDVSLYHVKAHAKNAKNNHVDDLSRKRLRKSLKEQNLI